MTNDRAAVLIACAALVIAVTGAALSASRSTADFVVDTVSPGNQVATLDPQPPATFAAPVSRPAGAILLSWTASPTASTRTETTYSVQRSPAGANTWSAVAGGLTGLSYTDTPPSDGSYDYKIRADISTFYAESATRGGLSDRVAPGITVVATPAANASGWRNQNVTVDFSCTDSASSIVTCGPDVTLSTDGASQVVNGQAEDGPGNTSSASITISLDKTPPSQVSSLASQSGSLLDASATVVVSWAAASDATSGVASYTVRWVSGATCPAPSASAYPNSASASGTSHTITGASLTTYCAYVITHDRADNQTASGATGPTTAR